jgi:D-alanyl-D-alanine carboxypeptidase (penicillin-binding protein 5/6)
LRQWFVLLGLSLLAGSQVGAAATPTPSAEDPFPQVAQSYLVELDGQRIWNRNTSQRLAPASLTKLMTALLVSEQMAPETLVEVDSAAARETGSKLGLRSGETWRMHDLLAATLIASANDACRALADQVAGTETAFVRRMNQRAKEMGLRNTRYVNACGHDAPGHYASAEDLRVLALAVMRVPLLATLVAQEQMQITGRSTQRTFTLINKNALIGRYEGTVGIKTGTTPLAGKCLVAMVRRGAHSVLLVMLKGKDRWWDAVDILDMALARANTP